MSFKVSWSRTSGGLKEKAAAQMLIFQKFTPWDMDFLKIFEKIILSIILFDFLNLI